MRGLLVLALVLALLPGARAQARAAAVNAPPLIALPAAAPLPGPPDFDADLIAFADEQSRMTVPVSIADAGPFRFVVDTGAERTVISRQLAGKLKLAGGRGVRVTAMADSADVGTVIVPSLRVSRIGQTRIEAPSLDGYNLGAAGILGIDALQGHAVAIDFDRREMVLRPAGDRTPPPLPGEIVVRARSRYGQLIVTDAHYHGRRIAVVLDTGSAVTVGNPALLKLMGRTPKSLGAMNLLSVTGGWLRADYIMIDHIELASVTFGNVPIAFADAVPFARFKLTDTPALMLGMDVLRMFRRVQIDFPNREVRFLMPRDTTPQPLVAFR